MSVKPIRPAAVAGRFYPGSARRLRAEIERMLHDAPDFGFRDEIVALVAPHAGYQFSGATAATAFRQVVGGKFDAIVVIAPSHSDEFSGISIMASGGYETPLGVLPVHDGLARRIMDHAPSAHDTMRGHGAEHSLEVELPFIQCAIGTVPIVPVVMLDRSTSVCRELANAIHRAAAGMKILLVASSDLYHGYSSGECARADERTLHLAVEEDADTFCAELAAGSVEACGGGPIAVAKHYARLSGASGARVLAHTTSAEVSSTEGGYVVGYAAIVYFRTGEDQLPMEPPMLFDADRERVLDLAKRSVRAAVKGEPPPEPPEDSSALSETGHGAFVTLKQRDGGPNALRGCIGQMSGGNTPFGQLLIDMAKSAALDDPRFEQVQPDELNDLVLEVSVLSPLRRVDSAQEVIPGVHGVMVSSGRQRGVLLPQVAEEHRWTREMFLNHACLKAGLTATAWRGKNVGIEVFTAEVIRDGEPIGT